MIDIRIPASLKPTVADAMRYALKQSGYTLCATGPANGVLYRQPLPAVQYQTGPVRLRSALQMMAGPAWQLEVDDVQRVVCHSLREGYQLPARQLAPVPAVVKGIRCGAEKMSEKQQEISAAAGGSGGTTPSGRAETASLSRSVRRAGDGGDDGDRGCRSGSLYGRAGQANDCAGGADEGVF